MANSDTVKPAIPVKAVKRKGSTKLAPGTTAKKLPWLDGKSSISPPSRAASTADILYSPAEIDSPLRTPQSRPPTASPLSKDTRKPILKPNTILRPMESAPTLRRSSIVRLNEGRVSSVEPRDRPPATRVQVSQRLRHPVDLKTSPLREESSSDNPSPLRIQRKPMVRIVDDTSATYDPPEDPFSDGRSRKNSLAPAPTHLEERSQTPNSIRRSVQYKPNIASPPIVGRNATPPAPPHEYEDSFPTVQARKGSLSPVPDQLEPPLAPDHVPMPVQRHAYVASPPRIVKSAQLLPTQPIPRRNHFESVRDKRRLSSAIEGLEDLVQEAVELADDNTDQNQVKEVYEIIEDAQNAIQEASALRAQHLMSTSSPLSASGSSEEVSGFSSEEDTNELFHERLPSQPRRTPPPKPIHYNIHAKTITPRHDIDEQRGSEAIDWANATVRAERLSFDSSRSSRDDSIERGRSRFSTRSDLLLPPQNARSVPRDHVDFVLRPARLRSYSRGRSRRRRNGDSDPEARRHHHRRSFRRSVEDHSRHRRREPSYDRYVTSFDDEDVRFRRHPRSRSRRRYRKELSVREQIHDHTFSLRKNHRRQPIARNWNIGKKRIVATIACINTALLGIIVGIYAGEVPRIQYMLADERHHVIVGNVVLYAGLAISTFISWPLPLLHGRKPYILASLALALPLQFPQAIVVGAKRSPKNPSFRTGLLLARMGSGLILGFANVNFFTVLLDLFGASLQSKNPHQEIVVVSDVRRHGGGMGIWLGIWSWCSIGSLAVGFQIGAGIIENLTPDWGFYIIVIILASALVLNILAPETRRAMYRKSVTEVYDRDENFITRRVSRGEVKLHISTEGPKYWFEEVWAGIKLTFMMLFQPGFAILAFYCGWIYAQIVLVIVLLGALLSRDYKWYPRYVGLGVMSIAIGALLAVPLTKAGIFSRERKNPFRTDSMTFQKQVTWSSHLVRRVIFTLTLPLMGLAYTVSSAGRPKPYMVPITFAGAVGFLSILAIAECHGLIMETFDTCDLQPGVNTRHRLQSMAVTDRRRRTNYSSFPRVTAGIFASQTLAFIGAAVATEIGGIMTRHIGAQASTGVTAGILLGLTILLTAVLWRFREVQVIPNHTFGTRRDTKAWEEFKEMGRGDWKAVVIGNPSGKMRRMSVLELGVLSRWTEIRKLNFLIRGDGKGKMGS